MKSRDTLHNRNAYSQQSYSVIQEPKYPKNQRSNCHELNVDELLEAANLNSKVKSKLVNTLVEMENNVQDH
jgi:hypothetical protein